MSVLLSAVTVPPPEPYDAKDDTRQQENFFYALNQVLKEGNTQGLTVAEALGFGYSESAGDVDFSELTQAVKDLQFNSTTMDFGPFQLQFDGRSFTLGEIS